MIYLICGLVGLITVMVFYLKRKYAHWSSQGVYQFDPIWLIGNMKPVLLGQKSFSELFTDWYNELRSKGQRYGGGYMFTKPVLIAADPEFVKQITTTDFQYFNSHAGFVSEENDPLTAQLFFLEGSKWKSMRTMLTPTFSSGKIKMMFNTMQACTSGFKDMLNDSVKTGEAVDIKDILGRFATDVIGSCVFGIDCNSVKDPDTEFRIYGKKVFDTLSAKKIKIYILTALPTLLVRMLKLKLTDNDVESFFMNVVKDTIKYREQNSIVRKDFMHMMLQLKNKGKVTDDDDFKETGHSAISTNEIAAQAFSFFLAGFETSSTAMTFALYELAQNQEIQDKLKKEINAVAAKHNGQITYDAVMEMHYLDKVVNESLRMHAPLVVVPRGCIKDYRIPGTDITIRKGDVIQIPILGIHMNPEFYPDPEKFDPERFSEENKAGRPACTFIPFGEGPRICIGLRFGVLQSKIGLISLLRDYKITMNKKTKIPLELDTNSVVYTAKGGVWINVTKDT